MTEHFTGQTRVADAIKADRHVVDRLIALSPVFTKLRNPVLRRVMGRLATLADAARVASLPLDAILAAANGQHPGVVSAPGVADAPEPRPSWLADIDLAAAPQIDVRPLLAAGEDPLGAVLGKAAAIPDGGDLVLEAPFDPAPLRRVLGRKGFVSVAEQLAPQHWRIIFHRHPGLAEQVGETADQSPEARVWRHGEAWHIDVRDLDPPEPMVRILALLEDQKTGDRVIIHHHRDPVFLYPELAERNWTCEIIFEGPDEVRLRLDRQPAP